MMNIGQQHIKAIFSDYDGTVTAGQTNFLPTAQVKNAIMDWIKQGHIFSIATGRPFAGVIEQACTYLGLTTPQIVRGGAEIIDPLTKKAVYSTHMEDKDVEEVIRLFVQQNIRVCVEKDAIVYTNGDPIPAYGPLTFKKLEELQIHNIPKIHIPPLDTISHLRFIEEIIQRFPEIYFIKTLSFTGKSWDLTSPKGTKETAVIKLMELLHVKKEESLGMGDGHNDLPLLKACGYKIAMGNASDDLKAVADFVAPSQEKDGVAYVINSLLRRDAGSR
jgi:Cof subfamily protein (haloacid dehalogenase superfamily)